MQVVARSFTYDEFQTYLNGLKISTWAKFIVVHNTSSPDIKLYTQDWMKRPSPGWTPEIWLRNLTSYYAGMGWTGAPHLFIPPQENTILVLNSLLVPGVHTPSWNRFSVGVETVGEFEREAFSDPTRLNLVVALAMLHGKLGLRPDNYSLGVRGLHFHKEDQKTTHRTCPGRNMIKVDLVNRVLNQMGHGPEMQPMEVHDDPHTHDIPMAVHTADTLGMSVEELTSTRWLQAMLNRWGTSPKLIVDGKVALLGIYSPTRHAVMKFQTAEHLIVDGIAGPVTRALLKKRTA